MKYIYIILGLLTSLCSSRLYAQEYTIREILITYIDMDTEFPFRIDSSMFESPDNDGTRVVDNVNLSLFQHGLDELILADPKFTAIDIRRKITVIYSNDNREILYADNFHIRHRGKIYLYQGAIRSVIEASIRCQDRDSCN